MNRMIKMTSGLSFLVAFLFIALPAHGASVWSPEEGKITYLFDYVFSGDGYLGEQDPPWLTAEFQQIKDDNGVTLTLEAKELPDEGSFVYSWYFNLDPSLDPTKLAINLESSENINASQILIETGRDGYAIPGDGFFDIKISFQTSNNPEGGRFENDGMAVFNITYPSAPDNLKYLSFDYLSTPRNAEKPGYLAAAEIRGLANDWSVQIAASGHPIPEPGTLLLLGIGLIALSPLLKRFAGNRTPAK